MKTALGKGLVRSILLLSPLALAGCLTSRAPEVACWNLEHAAADAAAKAEARFGVVRVSQVVVRAPYAAKGIAVLRANGTVAFDPYNEYAAGPGALLKGVVSDAMEASGLFKAVVGESSSARASLLAEVVVTRLAIDCREEGVRRASAELLLQLVDGREIAALAKGAGGADAADGNYGAALSRAVSDALAAALGRL
ncbi:MAG: hypothetical protein IKF72_10845 [Kiritimatiellae bacterium]|nr:hypothetical protein [Kiritimatiellia bacterium]